MKRPEEIRNDLGLSQTKFAKAIGSSLRTYQGRFDGSQPKWLFAEVIEIAKFNHNEVKIKLGDVEYEVNIKEIK